MLRQTSSIEQAIGDAQSYAHAIAIGLLGSESGDEPVQHICGILRERKRTSAPEKKPREDFSPMMAANQAGVKFLIMSSQVVVVPEACVDSDMWALNDLAQGM